MKRSAGVTASAVVIFLGAFLFLLLGALMFVTRAVQGSQPAMPPFVRTGLALGGALMLGFSFWGFATAVGLLKLRAWSRTSVLVFSGLLVFFCGFGALMINLAPFPPPGNAPPMAGALRGGITIFYGLLALLGGGWLLFFNLAKTKAQFTSPGGGLDVTEGSRPLSVKIVAGLLLFSAACLLVLAFRPVPATFFGLLFGGWPGHLLYIGYGSVALWLAIGLLRLNSVARTVAIGYFAFLALNSILFVVLPGYTHRIEMSLAMLPADMRPARVSDYARSMGTSMLLSTLLNVAPIWFLVTRRGAFLKADTSPADGADVVH